MNFWVVRENPDQSWKLLYHYELERTQTDGKGAKTTKKSGDEYGFFDLFADGRFVPSKAAGYLYIETYFPRLPDRPLTADATWESESPASSIKYLFKASPPAAGSVTWPFEVRWDTVHVLTTTSSEIFDLDRGLVVSEVATEAQDAPAKRRREEKAPAKENTTWTRELVTIEQLPEPQTRQLAREAAIYCQTMDEAQPLLEAASRDFKHTTELLHRVDTAYESLDGQLQFPLLRTVFDWKRTSHKETQEWLIKTAEPLARQLDLPSLDWQTTDLDGAPHALKDYRGKVVVIDFWYRRCPPCLQAMPQMKQLAEDFKDQPVAILGMNVDADEVDARFVIDAMKLTYPTLKDTLRDGIHDQYSLPGYPALVLIDQQGVVRYFHIGYPPSFRDDLAVRIRQLLAAGKEPPTGSPEKQ